LDIAGQFQQLPAPMEGDLLKKRDWRFYDRELSFYAERRLFTADVARELESAIGAFGMVVHSWDTSLKDRESSDFVSGTVWGVQNANRFMLRRLSARLGFNATVEAMDELGKWALEMWPNCAHFIVIETAANGKDAILEMKRRLTGVVAWPAVGAKPMRARAASPALEGHNCFLPGYALADGSGYDPRTPTDVQEFVENCARFPNAAHDDDVDSWSQAMNYIRARGDGGGSTHVPQGRTD
jgi:predicted phage terminase large subunit-like protein